MKDIRQGSCPQCSHHEVVQAHPQVFGLRGSIQGTPPALTEMNVFVCRRCGFSQWYAVKPAELPIDAAQGTRLIRGAEPAGPYR